MAQTCQRVAGPAAACAMAAAGLWPVQAAQGASAVIDVPCSAAALAGDMSSVTSGGTLSLTARCGYRLTAGLPVVNADLTILGNGPP